MYELVKYPDDRLTKPCARVTEFDDELLELIEGMREVMKSPHDGGLVGLGLAAPQVGVLKRVILVGNRPMINPVIVEASSHEEEQTEMCLSYPGREVKVSRSTWIKVAFYRPNGRAAVDWFTNKKARIVQHEIDHLNGKCIIAPSQ